MLVSLISQPQPCLCIFQSNFYYTNQKHPRCKKGQPRTKRDLAEKDVKSNGRPIPPGFDRFESFGHDELTAKHCYFRCSRPPDVKFLIKITRQQNIKIKEQCFVA